jgi:hypothetical protein
MIFSKISESILILNEKNSIDIIDIKGGIIVFRICIGDKEYNGEFVLCQRKENIEITIYELNMVKEKYLILNKDLNNIEHPVQDFFITGFFKFYEIKEILDEENLNIKAIKNQITKALQQIKSNCHIKNLKKMDYQSFEKQL